MNEYAIRTKGLVVKKDNFTLGPISLDIPKGTITCVIGRNGSGKTTFLNTITGRASVSSGGLSYGQYNFVENETQIRSMISYVYDQFQFSKNLPIKMMISYLENGEPRFNKEKFLELLNRFNINEENKITELSLGEIKKVMLSLSISVDPKVLFLDEVTSNCDVISKKEMIDVVLEYMDNQEKTVIISTNEVHDVEQVCDYIIILDKGQILEYSDIESVRNKYDNQSLEEIFTQLVGEKLYEKI